MGHEGAKWQLVASCVALAVGCSLSEAPAADAGAADAGGQSTEGDASDAAGNADAGDADCPATPRGACHREGQRCEYTGGLCTSVATCDGGEWSTTPCPTREPCPATLPDDGAACSAPVTPLTGPLVCSFEPCPSGALQDYRYRAYCPFGGGWMIQELGCEPAVPCGECPPDHCCSIDDCRGGGRLSRDRCALGEVCMRVRYPEGGYRWECADDECAPDGLDCACIGDACDARLGAGWQCTAADASSITCECPDC